MRADPAAWLAGGMLSLMRVGALAVFVPWPGVKQAPPIAKAALILLLTLLMAPAWPRWTDRSAAGFAAALATELLLGTATGLVVAWMVEAFGIAGQLLGLEAGFSYASSIDPASQADSTVLPALAQLGANLLFFALGFDRVLLRLLGESLTRCPPGACAPPGDALAAVAAFGHAAFTTGAKLALPVVALMVVADLVLALVARHSPQFQLLQAAFPAKILIALAALAASSPSLAGGFEGLARAAAALLARLLLPAAP